MIVFQSLVEEIRYSVVEGSGSRASKDSRMRKAAKAVGKEYPAHDPSEAGNRPEAPFQRNSGTKAGRGRRAARQEIGGVPRWRSHGQGGDKRTDRLGVHPNDALATRAERQKQGVMTGIKRHRKANTYQGHPELMPKRSKKADTSSAGRGVLRRRKK